MSIFSTGLNALNNVLRGKEKRVAGVFRPVMDHILRDAIRLGRLRVIWPDGEESYYGGADGLQAAVRIRDQTTLRRLVINPALTVGEAYMDDGLVPVDCTIHDLLSLLMKNIYSRDVPVLKWNARIVRLLRPLLQANNALRAKRNVAHHYDLDGQLYALLLGSDRQYSCAYFPRGDESLEEAQATKKRHIAAKLILDRPDLEVLDIGCGWGGMALTLARDYGARVTGITLSKEQLIEARVRATAEGLADRVNFQLMDYREIDRPFDRVVSVGMFEHVGVPHYPAYFSAIQRCLKPSGVALLHSIGRFKGASATNQWIAKYIFPGGYSPALSEVVGPIEKAGLRTADIEILRLHYAKTLGHWRRRFASNRDQIAALYDERFCRMFEFYLSGSALVFEMGDHMNFQIQLVRDQQAVPLTRDYITAKQSSAVFAQAAD